MTKLYTCKVYYAKLTLKCLQESKYIGINYGNQLQFKTDFITEGYVKNNKM